MLKAQTLAPSLSNCFKGTTPGLRRYKQSSNLKDPSTLPVSEDGLEAGRKTTLSNGMQAIDYEGAPIRRESGARNRVLFHAGYTLLLIALPPGRSAAPDWEDNRRAACISSRAPSC